MTITLSRRQRQVVLMTHIAVAVGWIGVDFALLPLVITGLTTDDGWIAATAFTAVATIVPWTIPALSLLIVATGVVLGLGTTWGLVRYWWVVAKLAISLVMLALVHLSLLPAVTTIDVRAGSSGDAVRAALGDPTMLLYPPVVSCLMLLTALALSIVRPRSRVGSGRTTAPRPRPAREARTADRPRRVARRA